MFYKLHKKETAGTAVFAPLHDSGGAAPRRRKQKFHFSKQGNFYAILLLLLAAVFFPNLAWAWGGNGTVGDPYTIGNNADMNTLRDRINAGTGSPNTYYKLTASFTWTDFNGNGIGEYNVNSFQGHFDGGGYTITLPATNASASKVQVGLFDVVWNFEVKNLTVKCDRLDGDVSSGALIGSASGNLTLDNVHVEQSGTTSHRGQGGGGFIGTIGASSTVTITSCSYINTGTLNFSLSSSYLDCGGFVGQIAENANVTFTFCLVALSTVTFNGNSAPFGGFVGFTKSSVSFIHCVQAGIFPKGATGTKRGAFVGEMISNSISLTFVRCIYNGDYAIRGSSTGTVYTTGTGFYPFSDWKAENVYNKLERMTVFGYPMSSDQNGFWHWQYHNDSYPKISLNHYEIQVTTGSNVSLVSGSDGNTSNTNYYCKADTPIIVKPYQALTAHQRARYSITSSQDGTHSPSGTDIPSNDGHNLKLRTTHDITVSAVIQNVPYPTCYFEYETWENRVHYYWEYKNPDGLSGRFNLFRREANSSTYTLVGWTSVIQTSASTNGVMGSYDDLTAADRGKKFEYVLGFSENEVNSPGDIPVENIVVIPIDAMPSFEGWSVSAASDPDDDNSIKVTMNGIDSRFVNSANYSYSVQRSINGGAYTDWLSNQNFSGATSYTFNNTGITTSCDAYKYKVILSFFGLNFSKESNEAHSKGQTAFLPDSETPFKASKGEYNNYVRLTWKVNRNSGGGTNDVYRIFRRTVNPSDTWHEMETVPSNAGTIYWNDNNALTGIFYEYKVMLYQACPSGETALAEKTDIGFTQAFGVVSGRITYGAGGNPVKDVSVLANKNNLMEDEKQYRSLKSTGGEQKFEWKADSVYFNNIWSNRNWTLQFWVRPDGSNTGTATIGYIGDNAISMQQVTDGYQIFTALGTSAKSEIIPVNKFSHIAITRNGNDVKIYTVVDANPDSIYIKNTSFTNNSTAAAMTAANAKISFGHELRGLIDDVRFWNRALPESEISRDYSRIIVGNENGLRGYWTFDEGLANYAFDRSRIGTVYNNNHASTVSLSSDTIVPDGKYQLALKAITDQDGNYQISGISYSGEGTSYSIVPSFGVHAFNPTKQLRYVSQQSMVHNATDFTDISAFMVRGKVVYEGGTYPVTDCSFEIDGQVLVNPNGSLVKSNNEGIFEISVPIGQHSVRVVKTGHTFANDGYLKDSITGLDYVYNAPKAEITFKDRTKIKLIGRVAGGSTEDGKPLGFGESINNIGIDSIVLRTTRTAYNFSTTPVSQTYNHNGGQWNPRKPNQNGLSEDTTGVVYNQQNITIHVSPVTGEFVAMVYPEPYDIQPISVTQGNGQPVLVIKDNGENINLTDYAFADNSQLSNSIRTWNDSTHITGKPGVVDHWEYGEKSDTVRYNYKWTYMYQATPTFGVKQIVNEREVNYFGETSYIIEDNIGGTPNDTVMLYNSATGYLFDNKPVFVQGKKYNMLFNAYEQYTNFVSKPAETVTYPILGGSVNIMNQIRINPAPETIETDSVGNAFYTFIAGSPDLTTGMHNFSATLALGAVSYYWDMGNKPLTVWHLGEKSTGTDFMTAGPDELTAILRDPPGSNSSAFIESGSTFTSVTTNSIDLGVLREQNYGVELGADVTTFIGLGGGVILELETTMEISAGIKTEYKFTSGNERSQTTTFTERYSTSDDPLYVGWRGDVFIGNSTNLLYGVTNGIKIQKGNESKALPNGKAGIYQIAPSAAIAYGQTFATRFAFTQIELETIMIPKWQDGITNRLQPIGTVIIPGNIHNPVYVSKLDSTDANFGKSNMDEVFQAMPGFNRNAPYDGLSYKIVFPADPTWALDGTKMKNFTDSILWANNQINMWEAVLAQNEKEKVEMTQRGNYSFGGGAQIDYSEQTTASATSSHKHHWVLNPTVGLNVGVEVNGIGFSSEIKTEFIYEQETGGSTTTANTINTGFTLKESGDDDELTVDYGMTQSGTFAFKTRGGRTSCPYEEGYISKYFEPGRHTLSEATMQIEKPVITVLEGTPDQILNVPANRTASFQLALKNESETGEHVWFELIVDEVTNPNGAELKIDGGIIGNGRLFLVRAGEVLKKTLTVGKGTVDNYDNIGLILRSRCQADPTTFMPVIADTVYITARFVPACSDVAIVAPANNFIINTETGSVLHVTVQNFDVNFPNFGYIRLEQRAAGTPTWNTVRTFYPTNLFDSPTNTDGTKEDIGNRAVIVYDWDMATRADGQYELRATTASVNISGNTIVGEPLSTYSTTAITGYKDMVKPQALGAPSPAHGIYGAGDELSVTFNEEINTAMVTSNNIVVTYGDNLTAVPITFVASANKITMEYPDDYFPILEGKTINITVTDIYDMHGNKSDTIRWSAFVNRNALIWETYGVSLVKEAGVSMQFTAKIKNAGNQAVNYNFDDANLNMHLPQWLSVNQPTGTLQPLQSKELTFTVSSGVNLGTYNEQIGVTSGNLIAKNLPLNLTVTGKLPDGWSVNLADYESTMTVTGRLQIEGVYQADEADILAAFIGDECVGLISPIKAQESSNELYTFLTIYGNSVHAGQAIRFKIWDASTGSVYSVIESKLNNVVQNFTFTANATFGLTATPVIHNALNIIEQSIALENGWNWISVNVLNNTPTIIQQFKDRISTAGELLKGQNGYIQDPNWTGTLTSIDKEKMYIVKTNATTALHFDGTPADPATSPITLVNGWNWIGYIPQFTLPVNGALTDLNSSLDDQIKGQTSYRIYAGNEIGWIGTLNYMRAGEGYMYNSGATTSKTFKYPSTSPQVYRSPMRIMSQLTENRWTTDVYKYSNTMTMTSIVLENRVELHSDLIEVAAFDNDGECRGSIMLQNVPEIAAHPYLGFLMVFGEPGDNLTLKVYDHATGKEYTANNTVSFVTNAIHGNTISPYEIQLSTTGIDEIGIEQIAIYPNPAREYLMIRCGNLKIKTVEIVDLSGRVIKIAKAIEDKNSINVSKLATGVYMLKITVNDEVKTFKFTKQ